MSGHKLQNHSVHVKNCPTSARPVQVRAHCRRLPKRHPHPVPMSVRIASVWTDPVKEITAEFLDQLARDWDAYAVPETTLANKSKSPISWRG